MGKGKRNRTARAQMDSPVTAAEIFAVDCVIDMLEIADVERDSPEWEDQVERAKTLLVRHRQEVRLMYRDGPKLLKEWMRQQMTRQDGTGVSG